MNVRKIYYTFTEYLLCKDYLLHGLLKDSLNACTYIIHCTTLPMQHYLCEAQPADMLTRALLTFQMAAMQQFALSKHGVAYLNPNL